MGTHRPAGLPLPDSEASNGHQRERDDYAEEICFATSNA